MGATPSAAETAKVPGVTEIRPGTYAFYDMRTAGLLGLPLDRCALRVHTTVVDVPAPRRAILDGGSKAFFSEASPEGRLAVCPEFPDLALGFSSEEHGHAEWKGEGAMPLRPGDRLSFVPWHVCPVVNLFDEILVASNDEILDRWPIRARGLNR